MDMIDRVISREGGAKITRDPTDPGGVTKYGISSRAFPDVDVVNLTYEGAREIYTAKFFMGPKIQLLPTWIQETVFDFGVHSGPETALRFLQKLAGTKQDGQLGPVTLGTLATVDPTGFILAYRRERCLFLAKQIVDAPGKLKYLLGWLNRALSV